MPTIVLHMSGPGQLQIIVDSVDPVNARKMLTDGIAWIDKQFPNGRPHGGLIVPGTVIPADVAKPISPPAPPPGPKPTLPFKPLG